MTELCIYFHNLYLIFKARLLAQLLGRKMPKM